MDGDDEGSEDDKARRVLKAKTLTSDRGKLHLFSSRVTLYPEAAHRAGTQLHNLLTPTDTNVVIRAETLLSGRGGSWEATHTPEKWRHLQNPRQARTRHFSYTASIRQDQAGLRAPRHLGSSREQQMLCVDNQCLPFG